MARALNDPKMTLNATRPKVSHISWTITREYQISLHFALRSLVFQIIEIFVFSIRNEMVDLKFSKKIRYKSETQNFKNPKRSFVTIGRKIQDKFS